MEIDPLELMKAAAVRAGQRRIATDHPTHDVPVTVFLFSKIEAASLLEALDQVTLDDRQCSIRDELAGFVIS